MINRVALSTESLSFNLPLPNNKWSHNFLDPRIKNADLSVVRFFHFADIPACLFREKRGQCLEFYRGESETWKSLGALEGADEGAILSILDANPLGHYPVGNFVQAKTVIAGRTPSRD